MESTKQTKSNLLEVRLGSSDKFLRKEVAVKRLFLFDEGQWVAFQYALERPAQEKPALRGLFRRHAVICKDSNHHAACLKSTTPYPLAW